VEAQLERWSIGGFCFEAASCMHACSTVAKRGTIEAITSAQPHATCRKSNRFTVKAKRLVSSHHVR
jgi:hypothetical protein